MAAQRETSSSKSLHALQLASGGAGADLQGQLVDLQQRERLAVGYLREKVNQLLRVMGTLPLRPEELDDETLFALDPLGIIGDAFAQVLEHLQQTNKELALARDEVRAIFDSVGAAILVVDREGRIHACNQRTQEVFFPELDGVVGRFCKDIICKQPVPPPNCLLRHILKSGVRSEEGDFTLGERHFHVVANTLSDNQRMVSQVALVYTDLTQRRRIERSLRETEERLRTIVSSVQAGILLIDAEDHRIVDVNDKAAELIGVPRSEIIGSRCQEFVCPAACGECPITDLGQEADNSERWLLSANGERVPVLKTVTTIDLDGRRHLLESFIDLSARKQAEQALQQSEQKYRSLYTNMRAGVTLNELVYDDGGRPVDYRILDVNPAFAQILGRDPKAIQGELASAIYGQPIPPHLEIFARVTESGQPANFEANWDLLDREFHLSAFSPGAGRFATVLEDITDRKHAEREMERLAYFDVLTGLPNRSLFRDRLEQALALAGRNGSQVALMFLDLDQFKEVNDTLGHATGDQLLALVAKRLSQSVRRSDTVARLGGDEFVIILSGVNGEQDAGAMARKVLDALSAPVPVAEREIFITGSLGIALYPHDGRDAEALIRNADAAMYQAKEQGDTCRFYTAAMNAQALERLLLGNDLRRALERDEFFLVYQPQINVSTGMIIGMEALIRWRHPELGLLPPTQFIPLAEETGLILPIGRWVLETACNQARIWQTAGFQPLMVSVNISGRQFREADLPRTIAEILERTGLEAGYLELEITETILMENAETTRRTLETFKEMGLQLAIDDFGTGYSSLSYLKHFPIDRLKIDRSFVSDITEHADDAAIAEAIIALAHSLHLKVIAEGVETREQLEFLRSRRCDEMQGFYFRRPETEAVFSEMLGAGLMVEGVCPFGG